MSKIDLVLGIKAQHIMLGTLKSIMCVSLYQVDTTANAGISVPIYTL